VSDSYWENIHKEKYDGQDWTERPSIFAEEIIRFLPKLGTVLELGTGQGQDSIYFRSRGYSVISTDREVGIIERADSNAHEFLGGSYGAMRFQLLDLSREFNLRDTSIDIAYAHLSLHYFDTQTTEQIFAEIYRVLKPGGILAFLVNSVNDPEYNTGTKLEADYFETEGTTKRYFSADTARAFAKDFEVILCDEKGETYKDQAKGVHNLIRFVGRKV